jgi:hypothetical protein
MTTTIDETLDILHGTGPEFGRGPANHGPMAAPASGPTGGYFNADGPSPW